MEDVWQGIKQSSVLLADLAGRNSNVFYELGLAHGISSPAVLVTDSIDDVPFDLRSLRLLLYKRAGANTGSRKKLALALYQTAEHGKSALPAAIAASPRAFETAYPLGGRSVNIRESDKIAAFLKDVPLAKIEKALKRVQSNMSATANQSSFGDVFWRVQQEVCLAEGNPESARAHGNSRPQSSRLPARGSNVRHQKQQRAHYDSRPGPDRIRARSGRS